MGTTGSTTYNSFNQLGVYGSTPGGTGYQSPFGSSPYGGSTGSYGSYGAPNPYGVSNPYGTSNPYGGGQSPTYETFGGAGSIVPGLPPGVATPGAPDQLPDIQDWQMLDDLYSVWW